MGSLNEIIIMSHITIALQKKKSGASGCGCLSVSFDSYPDAHKRYSVIKIKK